MTELTLVFDRELIRRYDRQGPRYTSYPTAVQFNDGYGVSEYYKHAHSTNEEQKPAPLSLYFHIPFCATVCFYCACNKCVAKLCRSVCGEAGLPISASRNACFMAR